MADFYNTPLHTFIEAYFKTKGETLKIINEDFFSVTDETGEKVMYTYNPKIASENRSVKLIAKSSSTLNKIIQDIKSKSSFSSVKMKHTSESIRKALLPKSCCNLCQFISVCNDKSGCCHFCKYYDVCNTIIENATFEKISKVVLETPIKAICFIYTVEIANDYLLNQHTQKRIVILFDLETKNVLDEIVINNLDDVEISELDEPLHISQDTFGEFQKRAIVELESRFEPHMELLKQQIEVPLTEKIDKIIDKYYDDFQKGFTKTKVKDLESMQDEALAFSKREINGYSIHAEYLLESVMLIETVKSDIDLLFKQTKTNETYSIPSKVFLNKVDIYCDHCGREIDKAYICDEGHVICRHCVDICSDCGKVLCPVCGDDGFHCSTCGEIYCENCIHTCDTCDAKVCKDHLYECHECGIHTCIDCYEICEICSKQMCLEHTHYCEECKQPVCKDHIHTCSVCGYDFCDEHIEYCAVCDIPLCKEHANHSEQSKLPLCDEHTTTCKACNKTIATTEANICKICGQEFCNEHINTCSNCGEYVCDEHKNVCPICNKTYCDCSPFITCKMCQMPYCKDCLDDDNVCETCNSLVKVSKDHKDIKIIREKYNTVNQFHRFRLGKNNEYLIVFAYGILRGELLAFDLDYHLLNQQAFSMFEMIKFNLRKDKNETH